MPKKCIQTSRNIESTLCLVAEKKNAEINIVSTMDRPYPAVCFFSEDTDGSIKHVAHMNAHLYSRSGKLHDHFEIYTRAGPERDDEDGGYDMPRLGIDAGHDVCRAYFSEWSLLTVRGDNGISIKGRDGVYYRLTVNEGQLEIYREAYWPKAGEQRT